MEKNDINDSTMIDVLNYSDSAVILATHLNKEGAVFEGIRVEGEPTIEVLSFAEIRQANSKNNHFKTGLLRFQPKHEQQIYEKLGIKNWKSILSLREIRDIILKFNPTKEDYQKIINVTEPADFERIRGEAIMLRNTKLYNISHNTLELIEKRYEEIKAGQARSQIPIEIQTKDKTEDDKHQAENDAKMKQLQDQVAQLTQLTQLLLAQQQTSNPEPIQEQATENKTTTSRGRKPKTE